MVSKAKNITLQELAYFLERLRLRKLFTYQMRINKGLGLQRELQWRKSLAVIH